MLGLTFSSKLDSCSYIISIAKAASKKIGALIRFVKFLLPEVVLYLYKSTIRPCMEYCCHLWAGVTSYKTRYVGQLVLHLLPVLNHLPIVEMQPAFVFSIDITLVDVHLNWLNWFHFLILEGGLFVILLDFMIFLLPFLDVTRMPMSTVSFLTLPGSGIL